MDTASFLGAALNTIALPAPRIAGALARRAWARPPRPRPVSPGALELHESARWERLTVDGWRVAAYAWGDGEHPVLLVHGWGSRAAQLAPIARRLLDLGYSPVAWDAPGHGDTGGPAGTILEARRIMELLQDRHGRFRAVVAHSLGAPFAVHALCEGLAADRVVLVSGMADFAFATGGFEAALRLRPRTSRALRSSIEGHYFGGDTTAWARFSTTHGADVLTHPVLLLHDEDDPVVPVEHSRRAHAAFGDRSRLVTTTGLGHNRILKDPEQVDRVTDFVRGADLPTRASGD
ncbi:alpha/beta hydrolase [Nocardiopsis sp. CNR-923]|uniref:alpha/beta hydrolase n=1 Tax=Nocardiopsis sp. CNR-923 TaxID=1904965 RepID=UPI00096795D4|nr:alpha/beta hydrolase [Nocardiopsis sp. CNR-923]OLT28054.1 alpha/beta hydrolase [Nocardiopsis sp. CNR-923]